MQYISLVPILHKIYFGCSEAFFASFFILDDFFVIEVDRCVALR